MENNLDIWIKEVDEALKNWSQGDCVLGEYWFMHRFNPQQPLTDSSQDSVNQEPEVDIAEDEVLGFAVVTQTCDLVRSCKDRPFVEVVPLVEVDKQLLLEIQKARRPIRNPEQLDWNGYQWSDLLKKWLKLIPESGRFNKVEGSVVTLEDLTAKDYTESDPLDLDNLSISIDSE